MIRLGIKGCLFRLVGTPTDKKIDLNPASGIYLVRVKNGDAVWNQKVSISLSGNVD